MIRPNPPPHLGRLGFLLCFCVCVVLSSTPTDAASAKEALSSMINTRGQHESTDIQSLTLDAPKPAKPAPRAPWQLVFVFADWCPYCHRTAPVVRAWAKRHHIPVRALSTTGKGLPDYPNAEVLNPTDSAAWFHGTVRVPALLAQSTTDPTRIIGIAIGAVTDNQLSSLWFQTLGRSNDNP